jgi:integrase
MNILTESEPEAEGENGLPPYLHLREKTYYFKRKIPTDAAKAFLPANDQLWKSLKTSDLNKALTALPKEIEEFDRKVLKARCLTSYVRKQINRLKDRPDGTSKYLLAAHIPVLLDGYEQALLAMDDDERKELTRDERAQRLQEFEEGLQHLYEDAAGDNFLAWEEIAQDMLAGEKLIAPPNSELRTELLRQLMQRDIEILESQCARLKGRVKPTPRAPPSARSLPTMRDLFLGWKVKQVKQRTIDTYETCVAEFESIHGAIPVVAIEPSHVREYRDQLLKTKMMKGTAENRIGQLSTLLTHGQREIVDHITVNPFLQVELDMFPCTASTELRRAYTAGELRSLFNSKLFTQNFHVSGQTKEALYWAPLLGPFLGARIEEVAQLRIQDVEYINGEWCLKITEMGPDQSVKTEGSKRRVPIHAEIIMCGFLAYVARRKQEGHERIFPSLKNTNKNNIWSNALTKRYGIYLDEIGLTDPRLDYHSFRYSFRQQCTICGIENEVRDALSGHWVSKNEGARTYLKDEDTQYPFPVLVDAIKRLTYGELQLEHLYVDDPWSQVENELMA